MHSLCLFFELGHQFSYLQTQTQSRFYILINNFLKNLSLLFLLGGWLSRRVRNLPFVPTTWHSGFGICVLFSFSMPVVFILNPRLVYTCVCAVLPQLGASTRRVRSSTSPHWCPES